MDNKRLQKIGLGFIQYKSGFLKIAHFASYGFNFKMPFLDSLNPNEKEA